MKKGTKVAIIFFLIIHLPLVVLTIKGMYEYHQDRPYYKTTIAELTEEYNNGHSVAYKYTFLVHGNSYEGGTQAYEGLKEIGQKFIVIYNGKNPKESHLLYRQPVEVKDSVYVKNYEIKKDDLYEWLGLVWFFI